MAKEVMIRFKDKTPGTKTYIVPNDEPITRPHAHALTFTDINGQFRMFNWDIIRYVGVGAPKPTCTCECSKHRR